MDSVGVLSPSIDVRHDPSILSPMSPSSSHKPLRASSSLRPEFLSTPNIRASFAGPSRHMISSPLRTCTPVIARPSPPPPIDTSNTTTSGIAPKPLERVPTEPASAPPPRQQPTADELALLGIKVRDFALEPSTLPRVPTIPVRKQFFRELKRPREETPEEEEARKKNDARRLQFNSPRRREETPEDREARRLIFSSPRMMVVPSNSTMGLAPMSRPGEGSFMQKYEMPSFTTADSDYHFNSYASGSSNPGPSQATRQALQRYPSEHSIFHANFSSPSRTTVPMNGNDPLLPQHSVLPPQTRPAPPVIRKAYYQTPEARGFLESFYSSLGFVNSQLPDPESQSESQSQAASSSQEPLPGLSISQTDSEWDDEEPNDEEYIKTPLVTPNGSLIFEDGFSVDDENRHDTAEALNESDASDSILDSSTLPESQVAELLAPIETGPEEDLSASQMGWCESQDLSQPVWQHQSQSQLPSQSPFSQEQGQSLDVDMLAPQSEDQMEDKSSDCAPYLPTSSMRTVPHSPAHGSAYSNNATSHSQSRPISRVNSHSSSLRRSSSSRVLMSASSQSHLRRSPSLSGSLRLGRRASLSSVKSKGKAKRKPSVASNSTTLASLGKSRYNLRTPSPKKTKLLGGPVVSPPSTRTLRARSSPDRSAAAASTAAVVRKAKSTAQMRKSGRGKNIDAVITEAGGGESVS